MAEPNFVEPNASLLDGVTPTVTLAGREWPVPFLTPRQQKHVLPALFDLAPVLASLTPQAKKLTDVQTISLLTPEMYDKLILAVFWGLKKGHPMMTRDQVEDMDITPKELIQSLEIISRQTGLLKERDPAQPDPFSSANNQATGTA